MSDVFKSDPAFPGLRLKNLSKSFGRPAVDRLDLTIRAGEFYALLGPNGAGKTTTLRMVAGLLPPDSGAISIFGVDALRDPIAAKRVTAWLPDEPMLYDKLTPLEYLEFVAGLWGVPPAVAEPRAEELLATLGYRSFDDVQWRTFARRGEVTARKRDEPWSWTTASGETLHGSAGDWEVVDERGSTHSVAAGIFEATHRPTGRPGRYERTGSVQGRPARAGEVIETLEDLRAHDVEMITIGQYLQPTPHHHPVVRYWTPDEFDALRRAGEAMGFHHVASGPLVRSSYHADLQAHAAGVTETA